MHRSSSHCAAAGPVCPTPGNSNGARIQGGSRWKAPSDAAASPTLPPAHTEVMAPLARLVKGGARPRVTEPQVDRLEPTRECLGGPGQGPATGRRWFGPEQPTPSQGKACRLSVCALAPRIIHGEPMIGQGGGRAGAWGLGHSRGQWQALGMRPSERGKAESNTHGSMSSSSRENSPRRLSFCRCM